MRFGTAERGAGEACAPWPLDVGGTFAGVGVTLDTGPIVKVGVARGEKNGMSPKSPCVSGTRRKPSHSAKITARKMSGIPQREAGSGDRPPGLSLFPEPPAPNESDIRRSAIVPCNIHFSIIPVRTGPYCLCRLPVCPSASVFRQAQDKRHRIAYCVRSARGACSARGALIPQAKALARAAPPNGVKSSATHPLLPC